ncbi:hypothetical protein PR002_g8828 [Phytophthora rubi]|uniref:Uncharacterized protein n=1 Tax=Phytophthora rubi TaxID=129364 RepID=A0A6A3MV42_9STRA|nr:hypothetical protein PR002_g8828 [Phytophthora rubi]
MVDGEKVGEETLAAAGIADGASHGLETLGPHQGAL